MGAVENIKEVANLVKKFNDIELNRRILNLENEVLDLSRDKRRAEETIAELERALKFSKELVFRDSHYWLEGDRTPYCSGCWESKRLAVHLNRARADGLGLVMQCPSCKHNYPIRQGV
jgi:uncharacterized protein YbaR (Trm112 family)